MAVPTISALSPTSGLATGWSVVQITGTNFRTRTLDWTQPNLQYSTVRVLFGTVEAIYAQAVSATLIRCLVPQYQGDYAAATHAALSVTVKNLSDLGVPITGETVTKTTAYTYERVTLGLPGEEPPLMRVLSSFIKLLKRELGTQVAITTSPDYSDGVTDVIVFSKNPSVSIRCNEGPDLDWAQWNNEKVLTARVDGAYDEYRPARHYQLEIEMILSGGGTTEGGMNIAQRMKAGVVEMIEANPYLIVPYDTVVNPAGANDNLFPMEITRHPRQIAAPNQGGVAAFDIALDIRGIPVLLSKPRARIHGISEIYLAAALFREGAGAPGVTQLI